MTLTRLSEAERCEYDDREAILRAFGVAFVLCIEDYEKNFGRSYIYRP